jgi:hypothetical protein
MINCKWIAIFAKEKVRLSSSPHIWDILFCIYINLVTTSCTWDNKKSPSRIDGVEIFIIFAKTICRVINDKTWSSKKVRHSIDQSWTFNHPVLIAKNWPMTALPVTLARQKSEMTLATIYTSLWMKAHDDKWSLTMDFGWSGKSTHCWYIWNVYNVDYEQKI